MQSLDVENKSKNRVILPLGIYREEDALFGPDLATLGAAQEKRDPDSDKPLYDYFDNIERVYYVPKPGESDPPPPKVKTSDPQELSLAGDPGELATGDWVIAQLNDDIQAASIVGLTEGEDAYTLQLSRPLSQIDTLFGDFEFDIRPLDHDVNEEPIFATNLALRSDSHSLLPLDLASVPTLLDVGRTLIIAGKDTHGGDG